jgi:ABC-type multidrug transport system fused ATPase/permease subunit
MLMLTLDMVTALVLVAFVTKFFFIFIIPVAWMYWIIASKYLAASRELKRLESVTRSPIYSSFEETLHGVSTIRAFGQVSKFVKDMSIKTDLNQRTFFYMWMTNRWLAMRTQIIDAVVVLAASISLVVALRMGLIDAGLAGLALMYTLGFTDSVLWVVRIHASLEMYDFFYKNPHYTQN